MKKIFLTAHLIFACFFCFSPVMGSTAVESNESDLKRKHLTELPLHEQLAHKILMKKLDLLQIYSNHLLLKSDSTLELMKLMILNKNHSGKTEQGKVLNLIERASFPNLSVMKKGLEDLSHDEFLTAKTNHVMDMIDKDDNESIHQFFELLEKEIERDIQVFEETGLELPQYKCILSLYGNARSSLQLNVSMLVAMNPELGDGGVE